MIREMAYSDRIIYDTLKQLIAEKGEDALISHMLIAEVSGIPYRTCCFSLSRLRKSGCITGVGIIGIGYKYRITNGSTP